MVHWVRKVVILANAQTLVASQVRASRDRKKETVGRGRSDIGRMGKWLQRFYHRERGAFLSLASAAAKRLQQTPFRYQHRRSDRWIQRTDAIWDWGCNFRNRTTAAFRQSSAIHFPLLYLFILCVVPSPRRPLLILRVWIWSWRFGESVKL